MNLYIFIVDIYNKTVKYCNNTINNFYMSITSQNNKPLTPYMQHNNNIYRFINDFHNIPIGKYTSYAEILFLFLYTDYILLDFSFFSFKQYIDTLCILFSCLIVWIISDFIVYSFEKLTKPD